MASSHALRSRSEYKPTLSVHLRANEIRIALSFSSFRRRERRFEVLLLSPGWKTNKLCNAGGSEEPQAKRHLFRFPSLEIINRSSIGRSRRILRITISWGSWDVVKVEEKFRRKYLYVRDTINSSRIPWMWFKNYLYATRRWRFNNSSTHPQWTLWLFSVRPYFNTFSINRNE
jgi:hypothetical protein